MKPDKLKQLFGEGLVKKYEAKIGKTIPLSIEQRKTVLVALLKAVQAPEFWDNPCVETDIGTGERQKVMLLRAPNGVQDKARELGSGINLNMLFTGASGDQWIGAIFPQGTEKLVVDGEVYFICGRYSEKEGTKGTFHNLNVTSVFTEDDLGGGTGLGKFK
jgi:hypothetical protein